MTGSVTQASVPAHDKPHLGMAILLAMTMALGPLALDTYLPAFPAIAQSLQVSVHEISLSISVYVFVLALGQLIAGPLSDRYGRGAVMISGLGIFALASIVISGVTSNDMLLLLRAVQALGGGAATVCVPAMVRDRLSGREAARFFSLIGLMMILAPSIAPSIGSAILIAYDWPAIFMVLAIYGLVLVGLLKVVVFRVGGKPQATQAGISVWQRYRAVFATRSALRFMFLQSFSFSVMLLFITHSAYIYQEHFGASPSLFALLFGANVVLMMVANLTNRHFLKTIAPHQILKISVSVQAFGILLLFAVMLLQASMWLFLPAMMITIGSMGAISSNTQACFMEFFHENGGTASALLGATQFSMAGLISAASTLLPESVMTVIAAQAACSMMCLALVWAPERKGASV